MIHKINALMNSEYEFLKRIGWFLFDRNNGQDGLTSNEVEELIHMLEFENIESDLEDVRDEGYAKGYDKGYSDGWSDRNQEDKECDCGLQSTDKTIDLSMITKK